MLYVADQLRKNGEVKRGSTGAIFGSLNAERARELNLRIVRGAVVADVAPGSPAERALEERRRRRGKEHKKFTIPGLHQDEEAVSSAEGAGVAKTGGLTRDDGAGTAVRTSGQRQQPTKRKKRKR